MSQPNELLDDKESWNFITKKGDANRRLNDTEKSRNDYDNDD